MENFKIELAQISLLKLNPQDVLMVKLTSEDISDAGMEALRDMLQSNFPNNKVLVFALKTIDELVFEVVSPATINALKNIPATSDLELNNAVQEMSCATAPKGYCNDCNCGKREAAERA